jgi:YfiH family protein
METLTSQLLAGHVNVRHAFFTRNGGTSSGLYDSLNCSFSAGDQLRAVQANVECVTSHLDVHRSQLWSPKQVHSPRVLVVDKAPSRPRPEADGTVTQTRGIALSVMGADCAPVLFSCPDAALIGAVHAGWKGALHGVLEGALARFEELGAHANLVDAAIGPCIAQASYEVGPEFRRQFVEWDSRYASFFDSSRNEKYHFDLPGFIAFRLSRAGVRAIDTLGVDTLADADRFFSYRRATLLGEAACGRQISVIMLK